MISVSEALSLVLKNQTRSPIETVSLENANKRVLARTLFSPCNMPLFNASAMDGYAFKHEEKLQDFTVIGESIVAGKICDAPVKQHQAVRIMTGAALPENADTVVPQEFVELNNNCLHLKKSVAKGENVRWYGEEFKQGSQVLAANTILNAAHLSCVAGLGVNTLDVYSNPKVCIIPTGSELVKPGNPLKSGQIYESSSLGLKLAMLELGITAEVTPIVPDDPTALTKIISQKLESATHILLCGGVSVGDFDFNKSVLADCGVKTVFWKVSQKPGKPFYFGKKNGCQVFGMPGNPVSSMICYYEYVRAALCKSQGRSDNECLLKTAKARLKTPLTKKLGMTHFIRAQLGYEDNILFASILEKQGSHMLSGLSESNGLIVVPDNIDRINHNQDVMIHWLL